MNVACRQCSYGRCFRWCDEADGPINNETVQVALQLVASGTNEKQSCQGPGSESQRSPKRPLSSAADCGREENGARDMRKRGKATHASGHVFRQARGAVSIRGRLSIVIRLVGGSSSSSLLGSRVAGAVCLPQSSLCLPLPSPFSQTDTRTSVSLAFNPRSQRALDPPLAPTINQHTTGEMPHNISEIDTSYTYNLHCPDATFTLASADGQIHRLVVWKACGVSDWLRIHQSVQRPDEPAFPAGDIRHLCISRDVVFPMYAVTEYRANVWNIEVRYAGGGESVIYPFQDKEQALGFQAMVTGYDVVSCLENTSVYLTYRKHGSFVPNALRTKAHPELAGLGEVQLWRRKPLATDTNLSLPLASPRTASSGTGTQQTRRISDNLSLCTDAAGQQFYLSRHVPNPILVIFVKDVKLGGYTMLRTDRE